MNIIYKKLKEGAIELELRYFDNAATTRVKPEVLNEMLPYLRESFGNPSSMYTIGREAKKAIEEARKRVAILINADPEEIILQVVALKVTILL